MGTQYLLEDGELVGAVLAMDYLVEEEVVLLVKLLVDDLEMVHHLLRVRYQEILVMVSALHVKSLFRLDQLLDVLQWDDGSLFPFSLLHLGVDHHLHHLFQLAPLGSRHSHRIPHYKIL